MAGLAFKVMTDPFVGRLTFVRMYSGKITSGSYVFNSSTGKKERISRIIKLQADDRTEVDELAAGDIGAVVGFKDTTTGNTFCDEKNQLFLNHYSFQSQLSQLL